MWFLLQKDFIRVRCKHTAKPDLQEWTAWPSGVEDRPTCFSLQYGEQPYCSYQAELRGGNRLDFCVERLCQQGGACTSQRLPFFSPPQELASVRASPTLRPWPRTNAHRHSICWYNDLGRKLYYPHAYNTTGGIKWSEDDSLCDLDFVDDIALIDDSWNSMQQTTSTLTKKTNKVGMYINNISLRVKIRLYKAIILATLLYGADVRPLTATLTKRLDATHHRWQMSILGISWKDRITNVEVRIRTGQQTMDNILTWTCSAYTTASTVLADIGI